MLLRRQAVGVAGGDARSAELAAAVVRYPQRLVSVRADRSGLAACAAVWDARARSGGRGAGDGRINVRASGTEPLVRVMVEAPTQALADEIVERVVAVVRGELGLAEG